MLMYLLNELGCSERRRNRGTPEAATNTQEIEGGKLGGVETSVAAGARSKVLASWQAWVGALPQEFRDFPGIYSRSISAWNRPQPADTTTDDSSLLVLGNLPVTARQFRRQLDVS